jgi:hypothetical protein
MRWQARCENVLQAFQAGGVVLKAGKRRVAPEVAV